MKIELKQVLHFNATLDIEQGNNSVIKTHKGFYIFAFPFIVMLSIRGINSFDLMNRTIVEDTYKHIGEKFKDEWNKFENTFNDEFEYAQLNEQTAYKILHFLDDFNRKIRSEFPYYDYQLLRHTKSLKITKVFDEKTLELISIDVNMDTSTPITSVDIKTEINA